MVRRNKLLPTIRKQTGLLVIGSNRVRHSSKFIGFPFKVPNFYSVFLASFHQVPGLFTGRWGGVLQQSPQESVAKMRGNPTLPPCHAAQGHSRMPIEGVLQESPQPPHPKRSEGARPKVNLETCIHNAERAATRLLYAGCRPFLLSGKLGRYAFAGFLSPLSLRMRRDRYFIRR